MQVILVCLCFNDLNKRTASHYMDFKNALFSPPRPEIEATSIVFIIIIISICISRV